MSPRSGLTSWALYEKELRRRQRISLCPFRLYVRYDTAPLGCRSHADRKARTCHSEDVLGWPLMFHSHTAHGQLKCRSRASHVPIKCRWCHVGTSRLGMITKPERSERCALWVAPLRRSYAILSARNSIAERTRKTAFLCEPSDNPVHRPEQERLETEPWVCHGSRLPGPT